MKTMQEFFYETVDNPQEVYENLKTLYDGVWITGQNQVIPMIFIKSDHLVNIAKVFIRLKTFHLEDIHWDNWEFLLKELRRRNLSIADQLEKTWSQYNREEIENLSSQYWDSVMEDNHV